IGKLRPADPLKDGRLPVHVEAMKYLKEYSDGIVGCSAGVVGPFTLAFFLIGIDKMLKMCRKDPESVHKLCRIALETCKNYAAVAMEIGLTPTISEPMSSCTVVSPKVFRELSLPYLKELVDFIHEGGYNPVIHICGQTNKIWKDCADLGIAGWSIDNVASIEECKKTVGDQCKIMGNVDPGPIMFGGTPLDVRIGTLQSLKAGWDSPKGFMVMSGCSLPVDSPFENIDAMMDTVREVGYPVSIDRIDAMLEEALYQKQKEEE
ncbi:MAG: uroporphyrinogen decarboxylase family protein, partial [Coriobacteriaceae bacterium]|nr:uroporphyrinogen decarboxylase family protein [Coriobacteriaceae bacterium]